jgi:hypothetical protein
MTMAPFLKRIVTPGSSGGTAMLQLKMACASRCEFSDAEKVSVKEVLVSTPVIRVLSIEAVILVGLANLFSGFS